MEWLPLRDELALYEGPRQNGGQPSWTLHDPSRNQFFRIDWLTFEILNRWSTGNLATIAERIQAETSLSVTSEDVQEVAHFLGSNQLLRAQQTGSSSSMTAQLKKLKGNWRTQLLHQYLFIRVPLVRPDAWLASCLPYVYLFYTRYFFRLSLLVLLIGGVLVYKQWEQFSATLIDTFSWQGLAGYAAALAGIKCLHELGHAFTAKRFGCKVPTMGVAMVVMTPMAYTDTTDVWKLSNKHQRLAVAAAGVATELYVAVWCTLAWALLPEGQLRSIAFLLATTTWMASIVINASPFMRFDGYYLLSDWLDMPNLHGRSFALARWHLRQRLLGLNLSPPEYLSRKRQSFLIVFAYLTWLYRITLFLAIAALVYAFFIKVVGIFLFIVEIMWFLVIPVWKEIRLWPALLKHKHSQNQPGNPSWRNILRNNHRARKSLWLVAILVGMLFLPWPTKQNSSALLRPTRLYPVYAMTGAQVVQLPWQNGTTIRQGQVILELTSPELSLRWRQSQAKITQLREQLSASLVDKDNQKNMLVLEQQLHTAEAKLAQLEAELAFYRPVAPFTGVLRDLPPDMRTGNWVSQDEKLSTLVDPSKWQVDTYLSEEAVSRIKVGDIGLFFIDSATGGKINATVVSIAKDATRVLDQEVLASQFGGSVMTRPHKQAMAPDQAVFKVVLQVDDMPEALKNQSWRGHLSIAGDWSSPLGSLARSVMNLIWREMGA
jgi:putative peptide zinc metalloprotease protein